MTARRSLLAAKSGTGTATRPQAKEATIGEAAVLKPEVDFVPTVVTPEMRASSVAAVALGSRKKPALPPRASLLYYAINLSK